MAGSRIQNIEWAEHLPSACPPEDASFPDRDEYYRLVSSIPPVQKDFHSYRMLYPNKYFQLGECIARSVSLLTSYEECNRIMKLPRYKNNNMTIACLVLEAESGVVLQTGTNRSHFSWWRAKEFDPIPCCRQANR